MRRRVLFIAVALLGIIGSVWGETTDLKDFGGDQLPEGEAAYVISDEAGLRKLAALTNREDNHTTGKTFTLTADIPLTGNWEPIGYESYAFQGSFDGGNHSISGLKISINTASSNRNFGLFGYIRAAANTTAGMSNLLLSSDNSSIEVSVDISPSLGAFVGCAFAEDDGEIKISNCVNEVPLTGGFNSGGIIGYVLGTRTVVSKCVNRGKIVEKRSTMKSNNAYTGGIIGNSGPIIISECSNSGEIIGKSSYSHIGGIIGRITSGTITGCVNNGAITGTNNAYTGGIVGKVSDTEKLEITKCSNGGTITGQNCTKDSSVGGLIGQCENSLLSVFDNYSYAMVTASNGHIGGVVGEIKNAMENSILSNCYAAGSVTGSDLSIGGLVGKANTSNTLTISNCIAIMETLVGDQNTPIHRIVGEHTNVSLISNYGYVANISDWTSDATGPDGADWQWNGTTISIFENLLTWNDDTWNFRANYLPQLKGTESIVHPEVPYLYAKETPSSYHTLTLDLFPGIDLYNLTAGTHQIEEDGHLHLQFLPEDRSLAAEDVMLLIDGVDTPFTDFGNNHYFSYILNPISADYTIAIALREYTVTLPETEGVTFDIGAGEHRATFGEAFRFTVNPGDVEDLKVRINGILLEPVATGLNTLTYHIDPITGPVTITLEGTHTTSNGDIAEGDIQLRITNYELRIENTRSEAVDVAIYTITGQTFVQLRALRGSKTLTLQPGIYLVKAGNRTWKVIVND